MKEMALPDFDIPKMSPSKIPRGRYWEWIMENILRAHRAGVLGRLANRPDRSPVDARFRLTGS